MADNEEGDETMSEVNEYEVPKTADHDEGAHGNDWEVLSLTASAYAAAPGPRRHEDTDSTVAGNEEPETSRALFMSGHFVFPPSQHENLPIVPGQLKVPKGDQQEDLVSEMDEPKEDQIEDDMHEEQRIEGSDAAKEIHGLQSKEPTAQDRLNVHYREQDPYPEKHDSSDSTSVLGGSADYDGSAVAKDLVESSDNVIESGNEDEVDDFGIPCGTWWKRGAASLYAHAKETSTFWSIFVAAAVMGLVVLGQRWQQERWQVLYQRWQLSVGDEKPARILTRLKDVVVGGSRRGTYVTATSAER